MHAVRPVPTTPLHCACRAPSLQEAAAAAAKRPVPILDTGRGPFASTLGVLHPPSDEEEEIEEEQPMTPPEEKPDFQQRIDWHFAAHFDEHERQNALCLEEVARQRALEAAAPRPDEELTYEEPSYQYMFLDEHEVTGLKTGGGAKVPSSWQEYQAIRDDLIRLSSEGPSKQRETAAMLSVKLEDFYEIFKGVLAEGWELDTDPVIEEVTAFLDQAKQSEADLTIDVISASGDAGGIEAGMSRMHPGGSG